MTEKRIVDNRPYQVLRASTLIFLVDMVNEAVERGYRPHGHIGRMRSDFDNGGDYYQAIYKGKGE